MKVIFLIVVLAVSATAQTNRTFYRDVCIQRFENGSLAETYVRRSRLIYNDQGRLIETVLFKSELVKGVTETDVRNFTSRRKVRPRYGVMMFSRDYRLKEFEVDVVVKDVFDNALPQVAVRPKLSALQCPK